MYAAVLLLDTDYKMLYGNSNEMRKERQIF